MEDARLVDHMNRFGDQPHEPCGLFRRLRFSRCEFGERRTADVFNNQAQRPFSFNDVVNLNDVGMLKPRENGSLLALPAESLPIPDRQGNRLHGHESDRRDLCGEIDDAGRAAAEFSQYFITREAPTRHIGRSIVAIDQFRPPREELIHLVLQRDVSGEMRKTTLILVERERVADLRAQLHLTADQHEHVFSICAEFGQQIEIGLGKGAASASPPLALVPANEVQP